MDEWLRKYADHVLKSTCKIICLKAETHIYCMSKQILLYKHITNIDSHKKTKHSCIETYHFWGRVLQLAPN